MSAIDPTTALSTPTARSIDAGGLELRLWDHGGSAERNVLFLHGYLDTGRSFDHLLTHLAGDLRALCLDWRGHGDSPWAPPGGSYHPWDHAKDLVWALRRLEEEGTRIDAVVAHSMGGNIAMLTAGAQPRRVPRVLLIDAFGPPAEPLAEQPARLGRMMQSMLTVKRFRAFDTWDAAVDRMLETNFKLTRDGARLMALHGVAPDPDNPDTFTFRFDPRLRGPTPFRFEEPFWTSLLSRITAPMTLIRAGHGYVPRTEVFDGRVASCSDLRVVELPEDGHHLHVMRPDVIAQEVRALLARPTSTDGQSAG